MGRKVRVTAPVVDLYSLELGQLGRRCGPVSGAGTTRGTARGKRRPALASPPPPPRSQASCSPLFPPPPSEQWRGRGRTGAGRAGLPRFGFLRQKP